MHIGMIGGIGPAATTFYYENLISEFRKTNQQLELTIGHADVNTLVSNISARANQNQAEIYQAMTSKLKKAGADVIVISSIAGHFCLAQFEKISSLPIVSILPALDEEFEARGFSRIGLLGNRVTMESKLFGGIKSAQIVIPQDNDLNTVHEDYLAMATSAAVTIEQRERLFEAGRKLIHQQGAEAVLLAGTDLFLAFDGHSCGYNTIDGALIHIKAISRLVSDKQKLL